MATVAYKLRGIQVDTYLFPTACPPLQRSACLMCSVNGIVRLPSGEIKIIKDNCIGCGACAERCPYGNISMHPVEQEKPGFFPSLLDFLAGAGKRARKEVHDALDPKVQRIAVKCDLCAGHHDYACVTACPVAPRSASTPGAWSSIRIGGCDFGGDWTHSSAALVRAALAVAREFVLAALFSAALVAVLDAGLLEEYELFPSITRGYTFTGVLLGASSLALCCLAFFYSLRKRGLQERLPFGQGTMTAWLWAHVYFGVWRWARPRYTRATA